MGSTKENMMNSWLPSLAPFGDVLSLGGKKGRCLLVTVMSNNIYGNISNSFLFSVTMNQLYIFLE